MKLKQLLVLTLFISISSWCKSQQAYQPTEANLKARQQFQDDKFGMFIHWGIYSQMADGEWVMSVRKIPYKQYTKLTSSFYPVNFNAETWVRLAKDAGMKYITITSRHHD